MFSSDLAITVADPYTPPVTEGQHASQRDQRRMDRVGEENMGEPEENVGEPSDSS